MHPSLPHFDKASVLVIGDVMLDRYWFGQASRVSPEAPVPVVNIKQTNERPGGAGNVALNIAALGAKVTLLGITGNDAAATSLENQLTEAHVQHELLHFENMPTIMKLRVISRHQQLLRIDFEETFPHFNPDTLITLFQKHLPHVNLIILSDYGKGTLQCCRTLIELAIQASIPVFVDPKGTDFSLYRGASIITPNFKEFEAIVGPLKGEQDIAMKAHTFLKQYDIGALLLTRGEYGMTLVQQNAEEYHLPAYAREVFDVTGAGDTVIAALGAAVAAGESIKNATVLANLTASLVVAKLGAATVSPAELNAALSNTNSSSTVGIVSEDQLLINASDARRQGKKIVFTNGCFDILHAGHVTYLEHAKKLGDYLIVAINDDASIQRLKGSNRPINPLEQRMAVLAGLSSVDCVIPFSDNTPETLLERLKPDLLVKGGDYSIDQVVGANIVMSYGGDVRVLSLVKNLSTSLMIERIIHQAPSQAE